MTLAEVLDHAFILMKECKNSSLDKNGLSSGKTIQYSKYTSPTIFLNTQKAQDDYFDVINNENTYGLTPITDLTELLSLITEPNIALYNYYIDCLGIVSSYPNKKD